MNPRQRTSHRRPVSAPPPRDAGADYRFDSFRTSLLLDDMRYRATDPGPGDTIPSFDLPTLGGGRLSSHDLGPLPVLLVFGSRTCPVTESAGSRLVELHREYGERVRFVLVNTREAHPGDVIGQPQTFEDKLTHAEQLRRHHGFAFEVAVDDIDGTTHRQFGPKPNSAYLIDADLTIAYRAHWANDDRGLRRAIDALVAGRRPKRGRSRAMVGPLLRAVGHLPGIVAVGGTKIERDVWRAAPPLAVLGRLSRLFRPLPADDRGAVAAIVIAVALILIGVAARTVVSSY